MNNEKVISIRELGVDLKVRNILVHRKIQSVNDLVQLTRRDLLGIVCLGEASVNQIERKLTKIGYQLSN